MTALMIVKRPGGAGTFIADEIEREGGTWTASGRWKYGSGRLSEVFRYTWPIHRVVEIHWSWEPTS